MEITLKAIAKSNKSTISECYVDGVFDCHILEDMDRGLKVGTVIQGKLFGVTAIPAGRYKVVITESPRFKRPLPLLLKVPGYAGVRIHPGNKAEDTEGCLLPGQYLPSQAKDFVFNSRLEFQELYHKIENAIKHNEEVWITLKR